MWAPPTIVYVHGKNENVQTKRKSTHICAQSFNILPTLSDHSSGILEKRVRGTARETKLKCDGKISDLLCSVAEFEAPPCRQNFGIAYEACPRPYPQRNAYLKSISHVTIQKHLILQFTGLN